MCRVQCERGDYIGFAVPRGDGRKALAKVIHHFHCPKCNASLTLKGKTNVHPKV